MPISKKKSGHHRGAKEAKVATSEKLQTCDAGKNEKLALEKKNDASQSLEKFDAGAAVAKQDREDAGEAQSVTNKTSTSQEPTNEAMVSGHHNHDGSCGCDPRIMASQKKPVREIPNELSVLSSTYTKDGIVLHGVEYYFDQFSTRDEAQRATDLARIMQLIATDLSEPYSIFTYRYFLQSWPDLCVLCRRRSDDLIIGCIVNKIEHKPSNNSIVRGYVAMLAVDVSFRCVGIGSRLVVAAVELMKQRTCDLIYLETPIDNKGALRLYESLGFVRDKRLTRYYMSGSDAFRLKLWLH